ncbi:BTAD domain-containing putative transcriptional regulator [Cupriavidus sp. AcVe19-1a]|uniref:BTAD domain-containing putative transcriptional regulator n=1 Tax=Cupriavidus sp. AcVe19-1a TaxID=2821359 RepID=UPI001AE9CF6D|nr:BTAD domain-containing putative transcriptional regulator [Cupriavidus sp. AcVe19-1a]MBP0632870.1 AAA family ATPase [Cupriavidus sp. AcVe19-1a]
MTSHARYSVCLFGEFQLDGADAPRFNANSPRLQALLACLVLHRDAPQTRQQLAVLFWPDSSQAQARNALRQLLFQLRKAWPEADQFVHADAQTVRWLPDAALDLDVAQFQSALAAAARASRHGDAGAEEESLTHAADLYRGDLLANCYDEWIHAERERLREQCIAALARLGQLSEDRRDYVKALKYTQQLQRLDPCREPTCMALMRLHALNHDQASAIRAYQNCVETLARELGVLPGESMREAYARLAAQAASMQRQRPRDAMLPMIGRHGEWRRLIEVWQRTQLGDKQFVLILGEAGIGKSRLAEELLVHLSEQGITVAHSRAYAAEGQLAFAPVTGWLRSAALSGAIGKLDKLWLTEVTRLLPELLTQQSGLSPPSPLTEYWQRQRFFEALARAVLAQGGPLLLLLDDLQWCDGETLEWLRFLMRFDLTARLMVVATARPEEIMQLQAANRLLDALRRDDQLIEISLGTLDAAETAKIAAHILDRPLADTEATRLFEESEGNPLFAVEMMRARSDTIPVGNAQGGMASKLPPKVYTIISNRLAQLPPGTRDIVGVAAIIGRAFTTDILAQASDLGEDALAGALDELWHRRIVRQTDSSGLAFDFSHDKIRDVAYAEVSPLQRRRMHLRVARALEQAPGDAPDAASAQIASHYEQAGLPAQAAAFYRSAAGVAQNVYAYDDAIALLTRGLEQADRIADPQERARQSLALQLDLAPPIRIARGWAAPELEAPLRRAVELSRLAGDRHQQARAQVSLSFFLEVRAELAQARSLSEELLAGLGTSGSGTYSVMAWTCVMGSLVQQGDWMAAEPAYQRAHAAYDQTQHAEHASLMGGNFGVLAAAWSAHALWFRGLADQALQRGHEALDMANRVAHPFSQALALSYLATQHALRGEHDLTLHYARRAQEIAEQYHVGYYLAWAGVLLAWAKAKQSPGADAVAAMRTAIEGFHATGARLRLPLYLGMLAECLGDVGETEAALAALDEAFECAERTGEHWVNAELYRLRGELLLRSSANLAEAESSLTKAIEIATAQRALPLELRATLSWTALRISQGRVGPDEVIGAPLARFTEGFDQPDIVRARALLAR